MTQFLITAPDGKKYKITGETQEGAVAALKKMLGASVQPAIAPSQLPQNATLQTTGPGPTGHVDPALYDMGAIGRRFVPGDAPPDPQPVTAADGTEMVFNPQTGQYTSRELLANNMKPTAFDAITAGAAQGGSMGTIDEMGGAFGGPIARERGRAMLDAARRDYPGITTAAEIGGALAIPVPGPAKGATLGEAVKYGAKVGATLGSVYSAASADGGIINRVGAGIEGAIGGAIFGAAAPVAVNLGTKAFRKVFAATSKKPTLESLKTVKDVAYKAVDDAGETFRPSELTQAVQNARTALNEVDYLPEADVITKGMMDRFESIASKETTLGQIDRFRRRLWDRYNSSKEPGLLEMIDSIDEMVASRADTSGKLAAARLANARYKKAELLELAFQKAKDQTASTGSGGNILNKYRQAVTSIINNPKQAKWFSADEIAAMRAFIEATPSQNAMRLIGKLAPSGNGLMTALNLGAVAANPGMIAVSAAASGAKALSDGAAERGAQALVSKVGGGSVPVQPGPITYPGRLNALAGPLVDRFGP